MALVSIAVEGRNGEVVVVIVSSQKAIDKARFRGYLDDILRIARIDRLLRTGIDDVSATLHSCPFQPFVDAIQTIQAAGQSGAIYNLAGQKVVKAQKGIFIQNGKKVIK